MFLFVIFFIATAENPEVRNYILVNIPHLFSSVPTLKFIKTMCNSTAFVIQPPIFTFSGVTRVLQYFLKV